MGAVIECRTDLEKLLKILGHYERLERSTGYHSIDYGDFTEYLTFYETFVCEEETVDLYWNYLKQLGLLVEIGGSHYLNMGRLCQFCSMHKLDIFVECAEVMDEYNLSRDEDRVLGFIRNTGRLGASVQKIKRLSLEAGIDLEEVPGIIDRLMSLGLVHRTEDEFFRAVPRLRCNGVCGSGESPIKVYVEGLRYVMKLLSDNDPQGLTFESLLRMCAVKLIGCEELRDILKELDRNALIYRRDNTYRKI